MQSETFISTDFIRHDPIYVRIVSGHLTHINTKLLQTRYVRRHGLVVEVEGGVNADEGLRLGDSIELLVSLFESEPPLRILGVIDTLVPKCRGFKNEILGLIGLKYSHLPSLTAQKLEAHDLLIQTDMAKHRSVRLPVHIPVEVNGIEVFSSLYILDVSMTGIFISTQTKPIPGKIINLFFRLPFQRETLKVEGRIVWNGEKKSNIPVRSPRGFGVEFVKPSQEARLSLAQFISKNLLFPSF